MAGHQLELEAVEMFDGGETFGRKRGGIGAPALRVKR
jgi:hypothetical protein